MTSLGNYLRRNYEPLLLSIQVFVDLAVLQLACWTAYVIGASLGSVEQGMQVGTYTQVFALVCAICLVCFNTFGLYRPAKSLLNMDEFKGIVKSTVVAYFVFFTLVLLLQPTGEKPENNPVVDIFTWIDLPFQPENFSRVAMHVTFAMIVIFMTISRFASFKYIQRLHRRGIGNRNVLIYGAGACGRILQRKFALVPTLGLNLLGFIEDAPDSEGMTIGTHSVLGSFEDLEEVVSVNKISEVFVAMPSAQESRVMEILAKLDSLGVEHHVVPRFFHLMGHRVRLDALDSVPLLTRYERRDNWLSVAAKRSLDIVLSLLFLLIASPVFLISILLIKRESKGPAFFIQERIGRDGRPFRMLKFRTMHQELSGDAPAPDSPFDARITRIGRYLRRYSLDELPQFLNVLTGEMSVVGPRPEMPFIVEQYGPMERERLRAKPGITGLWQISYARRGAIHENLDYDLFYIENQSVLLDLVIIALTGFAIVKGTGAY
jgi:exopolysaccharide biosynthesis polyprenyl glycosylphosphotransferase